MMKTDYFEYPDGATPLTNDELYDLIPRHVTSQSELNAVEQMNIAKGLLWLNKRKPLINEVMNEEFMRLLHKKLFGDVWKWAGQYRQSDKNIGVDWLHIAVELRKLIDDVLFQVDQKTYEYDEIVVRFHHRIVLIHPFPNGNGRHARLITDHLLKCLSLKPFTWGGNPLRDYSKQSKIRKRYIQALRKADVGDISELLIFVRDNG